VSRFDASRVQRPEAVLAAISRLVADSVRDIAPIVAVVAVFQLLVLREPFPDLGRTVLGLVAVVAGITMFVQGLQLALFPLGDSMATSFARKGSIPWLVAFAFALGFGTTIAEPALIAVADEAGRARSLAGSGGLDDAGYALALRYTVAVAVGVAIAVGVIRIVKGWPIHRIIIGGYAIAVVLTPFAPDDAVGIAYDVGGVTTSTITVPLVTALGIGLSQSIRGRSPMLDGFGLIALASLSPILFVLVFGMVVG
jgi:Protein of unknown function (DUF1538)